MVHPLAGAADYLSTLTGNIESGQNVSRPVITRGIIGIDDNILRLITCDEIFRRLVGGGTNISSLALGKRRSNICADAALWRRIDVNITSFDNNSKVFHG